MFNTDKIKISMSRILIIVLLLAFLSATWAVEGLTLTPDKEIDWEEVRAAFEAFYEYPSSKEAERILKLLSEAKVLGVTGDESKAFDFIFDESNYDIFRNEIYSGNRTCLEVAFCLFEFSDGYIAEQIDETIGVLIRINPELFLSVLYKYGDIYEKHGIPYPVVSLPRAYADRFKAMELEFEKRLAALQKVEVPEYIEIRNRCIKQLNELIKRIKTPAPV
ncbi:MAG: hypothetical protein ACUVRL_07845 [Candidatus Saccharicenans sp.]|uniref:hypothetical protein n=1 Tax=Candidatus Saccharicenans sp. TaxID=2819258 RepID=UPI004049F514